MRAFGPAVDVDIDRDTIRRVPVATLVRSATCIQKVYAGIDVSDTSCVYQIYPMAGCSFKSTVDESHLTAFAVLHVIDASDPGFEMSRSDGLKVFGRDLVR